MAAANQQRPLRLAFRVDSAPLIGIGHVMRCLALADTLRARGHHCQFICRAHAGAYLQPLQQSGHPFSLLPPPAQPLAADTPSCDWLATTIAADVDDSCRQLAQAPDWLIVDHYAIDQRWHQRFRQRFPVSRILAIDDLADRPLDADLLLDQTVGISAERYQGLLPGSGQLLLGSPFMLLRPEFGQWRQRALSRPHEQPVQRLLLSLGGTDPAGLTLPLLQQLLAHPACSALQFDVLISSSAPAVTALRHCCQQQPRVQLHVDCQAVAPLLAAADLAIGAAGSSAWERCCLGLPSIQLVIAANQREISRQLSQRGAVLSVDASDTGANPSTEVLTQLLQLLQNSQLRLSLSQHAAALCDGQGCERVSDALEAFKHR